MAGPAEEESTTFAIIRFLRLKRLAWIALALASCAGRLEPQRPAEAPRSITLRRTNQRPVELSEEAFRAGMTAITAGLPAISWFDAGPLRIHPAAVNEADLARTRRYLEWCRQTEGRGDCAGVLDGGVFREDARDEFAFHVAISGAIREAGRTLKSITRVLSPTIARAAVMLATLGVAKIASLLPMSPTGLPGAAEAAANAEAAGLPPLGQVGAVEGVAVASDGAVAVTVGGTVATTGAPSPTEPSTRPPVPAKATEVLAHIRQHRAPPPGTKGGSVFDNDGRNGGQLLPKTDSRGNPIQYREWDVNPSQKGADRGLERIVTGSDGRAYYTANHYETFTEMP